MLYDAVVKINSVNYAGNLSLYWGSVKLQLQTRTVEEMRKKFNELNVTLRQIGVDDEKSFIDDRILLGERLLQKDYQPFLIQYAKRGIPPSLRARVYKKIFNINSSPAEEEYVNNLYNADTNQLLIDDIIEAEIQDLINNDEFFVFEDVIRFVSHASMRDPQMYEYARCKPHSQIIGLGQMDKSVGMFPPNGILPCKSFPLLNAPFCYISNKKEEVYLLFRAMYTKYFTQLQSINSDKGIIYLCKFFEDLVQTYEPELCYHLNQLGINPLKTAFPWLFYSFIDFLPVSEVSPPSSPPSGLPPLGQNRRLRHRRNDPHPRSRPLRLQIQPHPELHKPRRIRRALLRPLPNQSCPPPPTLLIRSWL